MTTSISGLSGAQGSNGGEQTSAEAQGQQSTGGFRQPESAAAGVTPGNVLESNEPNRDEVRMKDMWQHQKDHMNLVSPLNRRKFTVLVVGTGLSGGAAAAALGELGYNVKAFTYHDLSLIHI